MLVKVFLTRAAPLFSRLLPICTTLVQTVSAQNLTESYRTLGPARKLRAVRSGDVPCHGGLVPAKDLRGVMRESSRSSSLRRLLGAWVKRCSRLRPSRSLATTFRPPAKDTAVGLFVSGMANGTGTSILVRVPGCCGRLRCW